MLKAILFQVSADIAMDRENKQMECHVTTVSVRDVTEVVLTFSKVLLVLDLNSEEILKIKLR